MEQEILGILRELNDRIPDDVNVDLLGAGLIDSFDIVNIVSALEEHFEIEIPAEDIVPEYFSRVGNMTLLMRKLKKNDG